MITLIKITHLKTKITINGKTDITIINFGTTENFMTKIYIENRKHLIKNK